MNVIDSREAWPFLAIHEARKTGDSWVEISEEHRDHLLNALPPIYIPGGFLLGEEADSLPTGEPIYTAVITVGGHILARDIPISQRKTAQVMAQAALK